MSFQRAECASLTRHFDVTVIGGGVNGVAIARECALAGQQVLLIEKNDFASGTTSRSTRIIHGGLRYLAYGEIALVRESLRERERLLRDRPHLVRPVNFALVLGKNSRHSAMEVRFALWLYRQMARGSQHNGSSDRLKNLERSLDAGSPCTIFSFEDAQCEFPERLVAEWLLDASSAGAVALNHAEVLAVRTSGGRVRGVTVRDLLTAEEHDVETEWVINAGGPWADRVYAGTGLSLKSPMVGGVRGSHIIVPEFQGAPTSPVYSAAADGRAIFVLPWNHQWMVGSTEIVDTGDPDLVAPSKAEVDYLLRSLNALFPRARMTTAQVAYAYAGVRPLPHSPGSRPEAITRRHHIRNHAPDGAMGMLSVIGGKLTTAASLARQCARMIGLRVPEVQRANIGVETGCTDSVVQDWAHKISSIAEISEETARAIAAWHGSRSMCVIQKASQNPLLRRPITENTPHILAEAVEAVQHEHAVTLADILLRRVPIALSANWSPEATREAAKNIATALNWGEEKRESEIEGFIGERERFLVRTSQPEPRSFSPAEHAA